MKQDVESLKASLSQRFGESFEIPAECAAPLASIASHRTHRRYAARDVAPSLLRFLCACALSAPSKSDLQQADILILRDRAKRKTIADLLPDMPWVGQSPVFLVFLANGRRFARLFELRGRPFANDHLDLLFNASV